MHNTFLDLDLMHTTFMDHMHNTFLYRMHNTFLDLDLVHNIFLDIDLVHNTFLDLDMVHNTLANVVHDRRDGSKKCSQCMRNVHGSKDD